ncbi:MAG: hypothetical protein GY830_00040 [Bacteroidetes bacterium]|nr:hypothetical protein [Bacteroidota bacterium]
MQKKRIEIVYRKEFPCNIDIEIITKNPYDKWELKIEFESQEFLIG